MMMNETGFRRVPPDQSSGSGRTFGTPRHPGITDPILSKRICFYKSGDPQFNGLRMVINNRTFKTFDALLDSLSKKVPLPFGVRNITTPRGFHSIYTLDELEDGKSYICSDSRKVKPINLALARKKLPPWYHARPASSRRRTVQQARFFPGRSIHKQDPVVVRTPKRLLVFRNGEPTVKHTVVLPKRTTPTYESVLEYISEQIQFDVVKLYALDGRRVDGLPGLILCSGTVVAAGREPFRPANYNAQKSPAPTRLPTNRMGLRRLKAIHHKKKSLSQARNFSSSSERYIVNRIRTSIAESSCNLPANPTVSDELDSVHKLESVEETEGDIHLSDGAEGLDCLLPTEDDIEKSFRVNQDGSMTVEMRVRLTIKEEETVQWTTTLKRSSATNQINDTSVPEREAELESSSPKPDSLDLQSRTASVDTTSKDKTKDNNDEDPPSLGNGVFTDSSNEEDHVKVQMDAGSPRRAPTPGSKLNSEESIESVTAKGLQQGVVGSYSYTEQMDNGAMTEKYCMLKQTTTRPVPKPRRLGSLDANATNSRNVSTFKSAEILQIESSGEEITETILHIYEQQTCQDSFLANICSQDVSAGVPFDRPGTSGTGHVPLKNEFQHEFRRPLTASESISKWRAESCSSDFTLTSLKTGAIQSTNRIPSPKPTKGNNKPKQKHGGKDKAASLKPKGVNKRVGHVMSPGKRQKEKRTKVKPFSSAGFIRRIYGNKSKSTKRTRKLKKRPIHGADGSAETKSSDPLGDTIGPNIRQQKNKSETSPVEKSGLNVPSSKVFHAKEMLTRQTSMHQEQPYANESLPPFNSSSSVTNEYVQKWLEKSHHKPTVSCVQLGDRNTDGLVSSAEDAKCPEIKTCRALESHPVSEGVQRTSVKLRVQSLENKSCNQVMGKTTTSQQTGCCHGDSTNTENYFTVAQTNTEEIRHVTNGVCSGEMTPNPSPNKIEQHKETLFSVLPLEIPLPPPPLGENTELSNSEYCREAVSPVHSSPSYEHLSVNSNSSDSHPLSMSPTSGKAESPADHTMEMTSSVQTDIPSTLREAPLPRTPSVKRTPLVSNLSLERKMSLRKACLDKYTLCRDATAETSALSTVINTPGDSVLPNGNHSTVTQQASKTVQEATQKSITGGISSPSGCSSESPTSSTADERMSSTSISSTETLTQSNSSCQEAVTPPITPMASDPKEASSPEAMVKKVQLCSSPSTVRKSQTKQLTSDSTNTSPKSSSLHSHPPHTAASPNIIRKHATVKASPPNAKKQVQMPKLQKRQSPYSQSLDMVSPPFRQKSVRKTMSRNLSSDNAAKTERKTSPQTKQHQTARSKATAELDPTATCEDGTLQAGQIDQCKANQTEDLRDAAQATPISIQNQADMKPVLDKICYSIKSIRQITQNKRPSCLEKSNSLPDFSSHVASTFGSSSKVLLAFLSVMTLKDCLTNFNVDELHANNVSCAEALKMIDSLREIACIEDSQKLKCSLSDLQQSASKHLLQSWKGFQELSDKCKSRSSTPIYSEHGLVTEASLEKDCGIEENVINELMDNLDIPERLKEELVSFSVGEKSDRDEEGKMSARVNKKLSLKEDSDGKTSSSSAEDPFTVSDKTQGEMANVDVRSIIKKFVEVNRPKEADLVSGSLVTETAKPQPTKQALKSETHQNVLAKCQPHETETVKERQVYNEELCGEEDKKLGRDVVNKEDQHQGHKEDKLNNDAEESLEKQSCTSERAEQDLEYRKLQMHSEKAASVPENELTSNNESSSEEEGQMASRGDKDLEEKEQSLSGSEAGERQCLQEPEFECGSIDEESSEGDSSNQESNSEQEENKQPSSYYYAELHFSRKETTSSPGSNALPEPQSPLNPEEEQELQKSHMGLDVTADESTTNSDVDAPCVSEEEQQEPKVATEDSLSVLEEEQESEEVEEHLEDLSAHEEDMKTCKKSQHSEKVIEHNVSTGDKTKRKNVVDGELSIVIENQNSHLEKKETSIVMKSDSLTRRYSNADDDSGNDHSSCEEQAEEEQPQIRHEQMSSSIEEELSYYEKESSSEEERANAHRSAERRCQNAPEKAVESTKCEKSADQCDKIVSQTVAERVSLLEKQVAEAQGGKNVKENPIRSLFQRNARVETDVDDSPSESPTSLSALCTRSAPQSSLAFSYDSSGVITTEPEGNRVRSIREMFLAKSAMDVQQGNRHFPGPNPSELSQSRAQTSVSGGYQSQTSSDVSSGEDDSARKSITKGFVRRTIERLYGKKNPSPEEEEGERSLSEPKQKKKEHSSIFSPFHSARSKAMSELSYFSSTNALDTLNEATRCITFNAQVGPGDSLSIDSGGWLLRDNTLIRKSVSDPVGIHKTFTNSAQREEMCEDTEENSPYSLFSTKSKQEDKKPLSRKCTYFSLPHATDSDACQDDQSILSKGSANGESIAEASEDADDGERRSTALPALSDFKLADNKVHPLVEVPSDGEVVLAQPRKGQGVVNRRLQEPDMLDLLYNFCGQHCPIL